MSGPSAAANVWSRLSGPSGASAPGAAQISSGGFNAGSLPVVNNSNLPSAGYGGSNVFKEYTEELPKPNRN